MAHQRAGARCPREAGLFGNKLDEFLMLAVRAKVTKGRCVGIWATHSGAVVATGHKGHAASFLGCAARGLVPHRAQGKALGTCSGRVKQEDALALRRLNSGRVGN